MVAMAEYAERELSQGARLNNITRHMLGLANARAGARTFRQILSIEAAKRGAGTGCHPARFRCARAGAGAGGFGR